MNFQLALFFLMLPSAVCFGANSYRVNSSTNQNITEHGVCKHVSNGSANDYFVPTKSAAEWLAFRNNPPASVNVTDCVAGFVNSSTAGASTGNLTIAVPSGTQADHVMVASVAARPNTLTITAPGGWTLVRNTNQANATASRMATY